MLYGAAARKGNSGVTVGGSEFRWSFMNQPVRVNGLEQLLIRGGILYNQHRLPIDGQDLRPPTQLEPPAMGRRIAVKICK